MNYLLIYSPRTSNRLQYILKTLMSEGLGMDYKCTSDLDEFISYPLPKINYSELQIPDSLSVIPHTILFDHGIRDYQIQVKSDPGFEKIFFKNSSLQIPFDFFGAAFWLLTRYEEYLPHKSDSEGRFSYKTGLAYQYDFLQIPLVNRWLGTFRLILLEHFPLLEFRERSYSFLSSIDVDNVYKYKHKGFVRTIAGFLSDKSSAERRQRLRILSGKERDPFDCYDFLIQAHKQTDVEALYFFLLGDYGPNDKNHSSTDLRFQSLIKHIADYSKIGLHPSFGSNYEHKQLRKELARLGNITHRFITRSRQHFSMLRFPQTYKDLLQAGMTQDYSMGYTNYNGFRASYCYPYRWYSLEIEAASALIIHPYCLSEVTLQADSGKKSVSMLHLANELVNEVRLHKGEMISIFHNHTFTEEMKHFYIEFLTLASGPEKTKVNQPL